jgi:uncharacterized protein (DUF3820 family)
MDSLELIGKIGEAEMPFGKYKNRSIDDIYHEDKGYLNWMHESNPDSFIGICLGLYLDHHNQ